MSLSPPQFLGAYSVSKTALLGLTKILATELAPDIRVNCIAPGLIKTNFSLAVSPPYTLTLLTEYLTYLHSHSLSLTHVPYLSLPPISLISAPHSLPHSSPLSLNPSPISLISPHSLSHSFPLSLSLPLSYLTYLYTLTLFPSLISLISRSLTYLLNLSLSLTPQIRQKETLLYNNIKDIPMGRYS